MNAVEKKAITYYKEIQKNSNLTFLFGIEQELNTTEVEEIDLPAVKQEYYNNALRKLKNARTEEGKTRAQNILDAITHATSPEHLLNIDVYNKMHGFLEFRGTPENHGKGYYDMPGNVEFRTIPLNCPMLALSTYKKLIKEIKASADKFGLKVKWRSEHLNFSIWRDDKNITSITHGGEKELAGRILAGILESNDEVRLLIPGMNKIGKYSSAGPNRLDNIRVVNNDQDMYFHRFEQRDVFRYGMGVLNLPYRLLIVMSGTLKGIHNYEFDKMLNFTKAVYVEITDRDTVTRLNIADTYRGIMRLELGKDFEIRNLDELFDKIDHLFGGRRMGDSITAELAGEWSEEAEALVKKFFHSITFTPDSIILPTEPEFEAFAARVNQIGITSIKVYDSVRISEIFVQTKQAARQRIRGLYTTWGRNAVHHIKYKNLVG